MDREPNPGTPPSALKSHEFSDRPMKSRIAGSAVQARRSAARVSSGGTSGARKALMSEPDPIDLIGGSGVAGGGSPVIGEAGFARSAAFGDRFLSASDCSAA